MADDALTCSLQCISAINVCMHCQIFCTGKMVSHYYCLCIWKKTIVIKKMYSQIFGCRWSCSFSGDVCLEKWMTNSKTVKYTYLSRTSSGHVSYEFSGTRGRSGTASPWNRQTNQGGAWAARISYQSVWLWLGKAANHILCPTSVGFL